MVVRSGLHMHIKSGDWIALTCTVWDAYWALSGGRNSNLLQSFEIAASQHVISFKAASSLLIGPCPEDGVWKDSERHSPYRTFKRRRKTDCPQFDLRTSLNKISYGVYSNVFLFSSNMVQHRSIFSELLINEITWRPREQKRNIQWEGNITSLGLVCTCNTCGRACLSHIEHWSHISIENQWSLMPATISHGNYVNWISWRHPMNWVDELASCVGLHLIYGE